MAARVHVNRLLAGATTPDGKGAPRRDDQLAFDAPWEVRALAVAVELHDQGRFPWDDFQAGLIASIRHWEETDASGRTEWSYYRHWTEALEGLLESRGLVDPEEVERRTQEILCAKPSPGHHA
jgi:nitrile hydratase